MADYFCADLVLTKGPEALQRRVSLHVPVDGTVFTVGRAPENNVVLDAHLLFASQRHCQLFVRPAEEKKEEEEEEEEPTEGDNGERVSVCGKRRRTERTCGPHVPQLELCLVDVGSSNGTFVNGVRLMENVATPLQHRDEIVFGGMRDILPGASIPADAMSMAPEIVTWRVALNADDVDFDYVATSPVLLRAEFLEAEEKRMTLELLKHMATSPLPACRELTSTMTPPPTVLKRLTQEGEHDEKEEKEEDKSETTGVCDHVDSPPRRSGTVAAQLVLPEESVEAATIATVPLRAVRIGGHSFVAPRPVSTSTKPRRTRGGDKHRTSGHSPQLHTLALTKTHWGWAVESAGCDAARANKQRTAVECVLPWSSTGRVMYCVPRRGLTVILPDRTHLPSLAELCNEPAEGTSFVTWLVGAEVKGKKENRREEEEAAVSLFQQLLGDIGRFCAMHAGWPEPQPLDEAEFLAHYAPSL